MEQEVIDMKYITKVYRIGDNKVNALRGADLTIRKGEFVVIMGPSGSGKSTLMNIIGALDISTSGSYLLEDIDMSKLNDNQLAEIRNKKIGFVFQTFNLLSKSNVMGNIEFPLIYLRKNPKKSREKLISEVIEAAQKVIYLRDGSIINEGKIDDPIDAREMLQNMPKLEDKINDLRENN